MASNSDWPPPLTILALAVPVAVAGAVLYFIIPVVGTAIGLAVAVSSTGLITAGAVGTWVAPAASAGVAVIGVSAAIVVIKRVSDSVHEKPYEWGLPLLAAFAGFASTLAKDTGLSADVSKWLFAGITALLIVVAGACYKRPGAGWKSVAVALYLLPPLVIIGWTALASDQSTLATSFAAVSGWTWVGLGAILAIGILIGLIARLDESKRTSSQVRSY